MFIVQVQSPTVENKVDLRIVLPDRNIATIKVSKNNNADEVYQVTGMLMQLYEFHNSCRQLLTDSHQPLQRFTCLLNVYYVGH